ncbi:MAG: aminopeptidase [Anaerolineaceae bacterium]|nr:MAG: aminopeptidase [Anaerolineaceae bacterium]
MTDPRMNNLARILVHYSAKVKPKDRVCIVAQPTAAPLILEVYREVLNAGGFPHSLITIDGLEYLFFAQANDEQLQYVSPFTKMVYEEFEAMIGIGSQSNTRALSNIDPSRQSLRAKSHTDITKVFLERGAAKELKWVWTIYPTQAYAQDAEMSLSEFEEYVYSTTFADTDDPVAEWQKIHDGQQTLVDWLVGKKHVEVKGPDVDLTLSIEGRTFENCDGENNMPDGEIFTGPVEDSVNGWVRFSYPAIQRGLEVEGIELHFEEGKVVKASAKKNEDFLLKMLDTDPGARYLGEFAIGTNERINRFIKEILFDEKIGGTIHMAMGSGYPETGSVNESAIHMDMICDMRDGGQIFVDGELIYESGEFKIK